MNHPENLDGDDNRPRNKRKTEFIINAFDPGTVWDDFGSRTDVVVSTFVSFKCPKFYCLS